MTDDPLAKQISREIAALPPELRKLLTVERERCDHCRGLGDLFNGGWKRQPCPICEGTGYVPNGKTRVVSAWR